MTYREAMKILKSTPLRHKKTLLEDYDNCIAQTKNNEGSKFIPKPKMKIHR